MTDPIKYYTFKEHTDEVEGPFNSEFVAGNHHYPEDSILVDPLPPKTNYAVIADRNADGVAIGTKYIEDYRYQRVYHKTTKESQDLEDFGPIPDGYTDKEPPEWFYHVWDDQSNDWVQDPQLKYDYDLSEALLNRDAHYAGEVDPLRNEAIDLRHQGDNTLADQKHDEALQKKAAINAKFPLPTPPGGNP